MRFLERRPLCNNNPSSAPHIKGRCFFLCWRCSGGVVGVFFWYLINSIFYLDFSIERLLYLCLITVPACVDYTLIKSNRTKPSNFRRFWTGCLLGFPVAEIILRLLTMSVRW